MKFIEVDNLQFTYPTASKPTLNNLSFEVVKGEIFGFLGPSGSGKSTTQKILYKILQNYQGSVHIMGKELHQWDDTFYHKIGVGFELPNHYLKLTGRENIELFGSFYGKVDKPRIEELFRRLDIFEAIDQRVEDYSKGMKMRLNFVRAIYHQPELLFLDEPTAGLDPSSASKIKKLIRELRNDGTTIFLTTHNMNSADELCDRVAFIVAGTLRIIDSPLQLKTKHSKHTIDVTVAGKVASFPIDGIGSNDEFLQLIKHPDLNTIHTSEASLESVFLKLTGAELSQ